MDIMNAFQVTASKISEWTNEKLDSKVDKVGNKKLTDENYSTAEKNKVSNMATGLAVIDGKLYLKNDSGLITESATNLPAGGSGGGGGGGSSASITLTNLLDSNAITVAIGGQANLTFEYSSSETNAPGTAYVYIGGTLKKTYSINTGSNTLNVGELVNEGVNDVRITCSDIYSNSKSLSYVVNAITLKLTSNFDDSQIYDDDITIRYTPYGAIAKDVHLVVNGNDTVVATTSETGKQQTYIINKNSLAHGTHDLVLYLSSNIDGNTIVSNKLYFSVIAVKSNITTPVISSVCAYDNITQGESMQVSYVVYDPVSVNTRVSLIVSHNNEVYSEVTREVNATKQLWTTRDLPVGDVDLIIKYGSIERYHRITVVSSDITIGIKESDLEFNLKSDGRSNEDSNRGVWESNGVSTNFEYINYESTGWVNTNEGTALRLSGDAKATIQFKPFLSDARQTGRTIEMDFAIRDVNNRNAIAIKCLYGGIGFTVSADTAAISSEQTRVACNYADEERIKVSFVIEPRSEYRLMSVYLNGILSGVKQYPENDNLQQNVPQYITVGSPSCSIDLYSIRSYNTSLTADEIRDNYIASISDVAKQLAIYEDNNIYDMYGGLSFDQLKDKIPVMVVTGALPTYKGDKKKVSVSFTHPEKPSLNYEDTATIDVQGTSSQYSNLGTVLRN